MTDQVTNGPRTHPGILFKRAIFAGFTAYGFYFAFAPDMARAFPFDAMFYGEERPAALSAPEARAALNFYAAILGAVLIGWLATATWLTWNGGARDHRIVAAAAVLWFVVDGVASVLTGFWQNAVTNTLFLALMLAALRAGWPARGTRPA